MNPTFVVAVIVIAGVSYLYFKGKANQENALKKQNIEEAMRIIKVINEIKNRINL
ncbi:MAG: hypothetical protein SFU99_01535 [Saprospiraceae bacterium]|nr:hypothetical protein [Saprospiraceae bacterium]